MPIQRRASQTDEAPPADPTRGSDEQSGYRRIPSAPRQATQIGVAPPHRQVTLPMIQAAQRPAIRRVDTPARLATGPQPRTTTQRMHVATVHAADPPTERGRHGTLKMGVDPGPGTSPPEPPTPPRMAPAGGPPPSSGRMLDELDFYDGDPAVALELGAMPAGHGPTETMAGPTQPVVHFRPRANTLPMATPGAPPHRAPASAASSRGAAFDPRPGIVAFAGFGFVPDAMLRTPAYALNVLLRSHVLRRDLNLTRTRRPQDVWLYEAALRCAHGPSFAKGLFLLCVFVVAVLAMLVGAAVTLL